MRRLIYGSRKAGDNEFIIKDEHIYPPEALRIILNPFIISHERGRKKSAKLLRVRPNKDLINKFSIARSVTGELLTAQIFGQIDTPTICRANCKVIKDADERIYVTHCALPGFADVEVEYDTWKMLVEVSVKNPMDKDTFEGQLESALNHMNATDSDFVVLATRADLTDKKLFDVGETFRNFCETNKGPRNKPPQIVPISFMDLDNMLEHTPDRNQENLLTSSDLKTIIAGMASMSRNAPTDSMSRNALGNFFVEESKKLLNDRGYER